MFLFFCSFYGKITLFIFDASKGDSSDEIVISLSILPIFGFSSYILKLWADTDENIRWGS